MHGGEAAGSPGVGEVGINGGMERAVNIWIDPDRLTAYRLPITAVRQAIVRQNSDIPGGNVTSATGEQNLRTMGRFVYARDFNDLVVATVEGSPVRIRDIGYAEDGTKEARSSSRVNGKSTVTLEVRRQSGANTIDVIEGVKCWRSIEEVPGPIDRALFYVPSKIGIQAIEELAARGDVQEVWLNPGAESDELIARAEELGFSTILACAIVDIGERP